LYEKPVGAVGDIYAVHWNPAYSRNSNFCNGEVWCLKFNPKVHSSFFFVGVKQEQYQSKTIKQIISTRAISQEQTSTYCSKNSTNKTIISSLSHKQTNNN